MAKKRKGGKPAPKKPSPAPIASDAAPKPAATKRAAGRRPDNAPVVVPLRAPQPTFWFGFDVAWAKLLVVRVVLFGLLAIDAVLQIRHAPRYGAGGFNVAQIPGLDALGPSRATYEIVQLVSAYLFVLAALGVATRWVLPVVTSLYAWMYFTSQLDGYQHHYLVALVLGISCFVPWQRRADAEPATPVRTWAVRLILVQLAILYLWAAISKMNGAWLDGRTLANQITGPLRSLVDSSVGIKAAAKFAIFTEITLALTVWVRPAWFIALPLGLVFHTGILLSGLEIGLFAWLMLAMYLLVVPDRAFVWIAERPPIARVRRALARIPLEGDVATGVAVLGGTSLAIALAMLCRLDHAFTVAIALGIVPIVLTAARRLRGQRGGTVVGIAHLAAILVWVTVDRASTVATDYYRFWGGSSRRLGDLESSERAYRRLAEIQPDEGQGHFQLGRLLLKRGEEAEGLAELRRAQSEEPTRARAYIAEAEYLASKGRTPEAIETARSAIHAEPGSQPAQQLLDSMTKPNQPNQFKRPEAPPDDDHE